jgi:hypothetical protein
MHMLVGLSNVNAATHRLSNCHHCLLIGAFLVFFFCRMNEAYQKNDDKDCIYFPHFKQINVILSSMLK